MKKYSLQNRRYLGNNFEIPEEENYVSLNYGGKYFDKNNSLFIGKIREEIENIKITEIQKKYFNSYHVPENIVKWDNAELEGITKQNKEKIKKGDIKLYEKDYKYYTTGKNNNIKDHKERLYFCKVK